MSDSKERNRWLLDFQRRLGLPLPPGLPPFVHEDGLKRLQDLQSDCSDQRVAEFRDWVIGVCRCFGFIMKG